MVTINNIPSLKIRKSEYNRYTYGLNNPLLFTDPTGQNFGNFMADVGAFIAMGGIGYVGASLASNGHVLSDVSKWDANWWKGALTSYLIAGSVAVPFLSAPATVAATTTTVGDGLTIILTPATTLTGSAAFAANMGISAGLASVISGAAGGVLTATSSSILSDIATKKRVSPETFMDQLFTSTVAGAISGAAGTEITNGLNSAFTKNFITNNIAGKMLNNTLKGVASGIITDEVKDVDKEGWKGFWDASIYTNGSNINSDMITNFAKGVLNLGNFVNFTPNTAAAGVKYPFSGSASKYLRGLYPSIINSITSSVWSNMTTIKVANWKLEYAPNESGSNFLKSDPPAFYKSFYPTSN